MILITMHTIPVAQKQTRICHGHFYDPSKKEKEALQWQLKAYAPTNPLRGPVEVFYSFYMPIPKGTSSMKKRQMIMGMLHHIKKPDVDNLAYILTNSLKGIIIEDDSQIVKIHMEKLYAEEPKIVIKVNDLLVLKEEEDKAIPEDDLLDHMNFINQPKKTKKPSILTFPKREPVCVT